MQLNFNNKKALQNKTLISLSVYLYFIPSSVFSGFHVNINCVTKFELSIDLLNF